MGQEKLRGLALLLVHRNINIDTEQIIKFSNMKKRNIDFII